LLVNGEQDVDVGPVVGELLKVVKRHTAAPADPWQLIGPVSASQALLQIIEFGLGGLDPEGPDLSGRVVLVE
jgi:hypothetical protein